MTFEKAFQQIWSVMDGFSLMSFTSHFIGLVPTEMCSELMRGHNVTPSCACLTRSVPTACNPSLCRAKGRGLQPKGLRVKETADFKVYTKGAGTGELKVTIKGPSEF